MRLTFILLACFTCLPVYADVRISFALGEGNIDLDANFLDLSLETGDEVAYAAYLGYQSESNITVDFGVAGAEDSSELALFFTDVLDSISLDTKELLIGYHLRYQYIFFEPKIGVGHWDLTLEEGELFNPGPEARFDESGTDFLYMLTAGVKMGSVFAMSLSYKDQDYEYGSAKSTLLGFHFTF